MKRFWSKVDKNGPIPRHSPQLGRCWVFLGGLDPDGYGNFWLNGKTLRAHIVAWILTGGNDSVPLGQVFDHLCRNRACVNPGHTEPVTNRENVLRGIGPSAANSRKTHCKRGHELSGANLDPRLLSQGKRICKICLIARKHTWRESRPDVVDRERAQARIRSKARYEQLRDEINAKRRADRIANPQKYDAARERNRAAYYHRKASGK